LLPNICENLFFEEPKEGRRKEFKDNLLYPSPIYNILRVLSIKVGNLTAFMQTTPASAANGSA